MGLMSKSKFNMWRACVAAVHLDKLVTTQERNWVKDKTRSLTLSNDLRLILIADLETGGNFE